MNSEQNKTKVKRLGRGGYLHSVVPILNNSGEVIQRIVKPLMVEVRFRDIVQILIGASILAIPIAFTEETWILGESLPLINVAGLAFVSICFIGVFVYTSFYRFYMKDYVWEFIKRVISIYLISLIVVGLLMTIIQQAPWDSDFVLAIKRVIIVTFPASMSASITDSLK